MFFSASIALTLILSMSGIAVQSAPVVRHLFFVSNPDPQHSGISIQIPRQTTDEPQACSDFNGQGLCFPIPIGPGGECIAVSNIKSLILPNNGAECFTYGSTDCSVTDSGVGDLPGSGNIFDFNGTKSVECFT
ncbi:hypothetical protein B0H16DRAFT_1888444 [Mycena metata]|uniref:Uncharacterized protein n=1 Tax=Mycena metata TaxID=1033252 RepID=A0AAD7N6T6_9AGAR|nr:hypothetical protein B0H16DRAFT_1888444 [Mycena metata]